MPKWRDEDHAGEEPTLNKVVTTATDEIKREKGYILVVRHVKAFRWGKGFMSEVYSDSGGSGKNSTVHSGTGKQVYELAVADGEADFKEKMEEVERINQQIADAKK